MGQCPPCQELAVKSEHWDLHMLAATDNHVQVCIRIRLLCPISGTEVISLQWNPLTKADLLLSQAEPGGHLSA